jgi:signal transduction histidine kinase
MGDLQALLKNLPVTGPERSGAGIKAAEAGLPSQRSLRVELIIFLALLAAFAGVLFKDAIVQRHFTLDRYTIAGFKIYPYADNLSGGRSTISVSPDNPLAWRCDVRSGPGYPYPYCGYGILMDVSRHGVGRDFTIYDKAVIDLDYQGPSRQLKLAFKDAHPQYAFPNKGEDAQPVVIQFPVKPGHNRVTVNLADAAVELWWAYAHQNIPESGRPHLANVIAVDIQLADNPMGRHDIELRSITMRGNTIAPERWYLLLLGSLIGVVAFYLVYAMRRTGRIHAERQRFLLAEARLLKEARDAAESASQAKSRFIAHMSHELRTPLNAVLGHAQLLQSSKLEDRDVSAARTIQQSGEHLLSLIGDILDLSRIEAGKLELAPRSTDVRQLIGGVAEMMVLRAREKGIALRWSIAADVPRCVVVDDMRLRQVLINLLGNAFKFTERGEVRLQVGVVASGAGEVQLRFDIRDTGTGISADHLAVIFEPFEQAGNDISRSNGSGLGLTISRRIIEKMGGIIQVESTPVVGSRFWFDLALPLGDTTSLPATEQVDALQMAAPHEPDRPFAMLPDALSMEKLHALALAGNMHALRTEAMRLMSVEPGLRPFADALVGLARNYQSQAVLELIERHKAEAGIP